MDSYHEKLVKARKQLDSLVNLYVEKDNTIVMIPKDNIYMNFSVGNQDYVAFSNDLDSEDEINMMFAQADVFDGDRILRNIDSDEEYEEVVSVFNKILSFMED